MDYYALGIFGLFLMTFIAATLVPLASEAVVIAYLYLNYSPLEVFFIATAGNTLGSYVNYWIGLLGNPKWLLRFGVSELKLASFEQRVKKYGHWTGFLSWLPFVGDPLTVAMGFFRTKMWPSFIVILVSKALRYAVLILIWKYFAM
jgi:membrane protein YqaA with SNARE-associated domain